MVGDLNVAIEKHIISAFHLAERLVVALGKTVVAVELDEAYLGMMGLEPNNRVVGRGIVGNDNFGSAS